MGWIMDNADNQLRIAIKNKVDEEKDKDHKTRTISITSDAFEFDKNSDKLDKREQLLDWLISTEQLEIIFAYPKDLKPIDHHSPKAHKKIGYFKFPDESICGFRGSWNETISGSAHSDEDVSVFSGNRKEVNMAE